MITKEITGNGEMVITRLSGEITGQEVMDDFLAMFKLTDQVKQSGFSHLYDMSQVTGIAMDENDVRRMTSIGMANRMTDIDVRTAIVAKEPHCRELAYLHRDLSNRLGLKKVEVFDNRTSALDWLQL